LGERDQRICALFDPTTARLNQANWPADRVFEVGDTVTDIPPGAGEENPVAPLGVTEIVALADWVGSAMLAAVTVTVWGLKTELGAV
jgi:hypothetical protein